MFFYESRLSSDMGHMTYIDIFSSDEYHKNSKEQADRALEVLSECLNKQESQAVNLAKHHESFLKAGIDWEENVKQSFVQTEVTKFTNFFHLNCLEDDPVSGGIIQYIVSGDFTLG